MIDSLSPEKAGVEGSTPLGGMYSVEFGNFVQGVYAGAGNTFKIVLAY
jgi:hypothetical protein